MKEARVIHGRLITPEEVSQIRDLIKGHADWSRRRLSIEVSTQWAWRNAKGQLRDMACRTVLLRLHRAGIIELPSPRRKGQNRWRQEPVKDIKLDTSPFDANLSSLRPLNISLVMSGSAESRLFRYLLQEYHYLGLSHVPGETLSYLMYSACGRPVACLLFAAAAWKCEARDTHIGWSDAQRQGRLCFLTNNMRFLIPPWVWVKCLASHVLSLASRRICSDWDSKYGHRIHLLETFVDKSRFPGTCYRAANWLYAGETKGRSRHDGERKMNVSIKDVYLYPLVKDFRERLSQ